MITQARITEDIKSAGLDWITALRAPAIKALLESGTLQLSLFDQRDIASITAPDLPNERLVVCRNPDLAAERARKREDLLTATERDLARIKAAVARKRDPLRGTAETSWRRRSARPLPSKSRPRALTRRRPAGAQLSLAAGGSCDLGAQHDHHRNHTKLSAHCADQSDTDPTGSNRRRSISSASSVASSAASHRQIVLAIQRPCRAMT